MSIKITLTEIKQIVREEIEIHKYGKIKNKKKYINESKGMDRNLAKLRKLIKEEVRILSLEEKYEYVKKDLSQEMFNLIVNHLKKINNSSTAKRFIRSIDKEKVEKIKKLMFSEQIGGLSQYDSKKAAKFFPTYIHHMIGEYLGLLTQSGIDNDVFGKKQKNIPGDFPEPGSGVRDLLSGSGISVSQGRGSGASDTDMQIKGGSGVINKYGSSVR